MATSNKDVKLRLSVETLGEESVARLKDAVLKLAKEGGEAAPAFQGLADEIDRLGASNDALQQFQALADQTERLGLEQTAAAERLAALGAQLAAARANTEGFAEAQRQATGALASADRDVTKFTAELVKLRGSYVGSAKDTDEYRTKLGALVDKQTAARLAAQEQGAALTEANKAYTAAAREQAKLQTAYDKTESSVKRVQTVFQQTATALQEAEAAARSLGLSTDDVASAQGQLSTSFAAVGAEAEELQYWLDAGAQALREQQAESKRTIQTQQEHLTSLNAEIRLRQQLIAERTKAAEAARAGAAAAAAEEQAQRAAIAAARAKADADAEMLEHNRLLAIQQAAMNDLYRRGADALNQEAAAIREAAQATALYEAAKERQTLAERAAAEEAEKAAARIASAFDKVGIQSVQDLEREILEVRQAMETLRATAGLTGPAIDRAFATGEQRIQALERDIRQATGALTAADRAADIFRNSMGQIAAGNLVADAIGSMVERVKELGREFVNSIVALDQMRRGLNAVYKDTAVTTAQIEFLRATASDAGVSVGALSQEFLRFSASMTTAGVPLQQSNDLFEALIKAGSSLGLESEAVAGALNALGQMAAKGCHAPGTLIRMADGTALAVEDIAVGDAVMGSDGRARKVLELAAGTEAMYRITPTEGTPFLVNRSHKLRLLARDGLCSTVMLRDYLYEIEGVGGSLIRNGAATTFQVRSEGVGPYHGFVLDGDHLYLDAQGFEHHNTVSMEELRQQLGDRLPGAFGLVAKGLGITQAELVKLVESGNLAARDLFPALTQSLKSLHGETTGLVPTWERFKGALTEMAQNAGDAGWAVVLNGALKLLGGTILTVLHAVSLLSEGFFSVGRAAIVFFESLRGNGAQAMAWFNEESLKMQERLERQKQSLDKMLEPQKQYSAGQAAAAQSNTKLAESVAEVVARTTGLSREQQLQAVATALAGNAALDASTRYVQFGLAAAALLEKQKEQTLASTKTAEAAKIEGEALIQIAQLRGDQVGILEASVAAAEKEAAAMAKVSESRNTELAILKQQLAQVEVNRVARQLSTEDVKVEVQEIEQKIIAAEGEAARSRESAAALRIEAVERRVATQTYADNSARVNEYRTAVEIATRAVEVAASASRVGLATDAEVLSAKERLAVAQRLYSDALQDSVSKIDLETAAKSAGLQVEAASYGARVQSAEIMARQARLLGDTTQATYWEIEAKRASIEVTRINYEIKRLEAEAELKALEIQKLLIPMNDTLRTQKLQEIEIRMQLQKVKLDEAGAGDEVVRALEHEVSAMIVNQNQRRASGGAISTDTSLRQQNAGAIDKQTTALQNQQAVLGQKPVANQRQVDSENPYGKTSDGFKANKDGSAAGGFTNTLVTKTAFDLVEKSRAGLLTAADLEMAQEGFRQAQEVMRYIQNTQAGFASQIARSSSEAIYQGAKSALEKVNRLVAIEAEASAEPRVQAAQTAAAQPAAAQPPTSNKTITVRLQNGNNTESVTVANQAQADALIRALQRASLTAS